MAEIREATWNDFDAVLALTDAQRRAAVGGSNVEAAELRLRWGLPGFRGWVAAEGDRVVGHASLDATQQASVTAADPLVGDALFARVERGAHERSFDHVVVTAVRDDTALWALVERNGLVLDREILRMGRALVDGLPHPRWPTGVTVRTYADTDGERVHALLDKAYAGWDLDYVPLDHDAWVELMTGHDEFDAGLWFIAERGDELVGCALQWREQAGRGWVKDLVVRESARGRGLGTALLQHALQVYVARGATMVGLKVDSTNPTGAQHLYERAGFVTGERQAVWVKRL